MLSYRRETALQGALVLPKNGRLELEDSIFYGHWVPCLLDEDSPNGPIKLLTVAC